MQHKHFLSKIILDHEKIVCLNSNNIICIHTFQLNWQKKTIPIAQMKRRNKSFIYKSKQCLSLKIKNIDISPIIIPKLKQKFSSLNKYFHNATLTMLENFKITNICPNYEHFSKIKIICPKLRTFVRNYEYLSKIMNTCPKLRIFVQYYEHLSWITKICPKLRIFVRIY